MASAPRPSFGRRQHEAPARYPRCRTRTGSSHRQQSRRDLSRYQPDRSPPYPERAMKRVLTGRAYTGRFEASRWPSMTRRWWGAPPRCDRVSPPVSSRVSRATSQRAHGGVAIPQRIRRSRIRRASLRPSGLFHPASSTAAPGSSEGSVDRWWPPGSTRTTPIRIPTLRLSVSLPLPPSISLPLPPSISLLTGSASLGASLQLFVLPVTF
jgi:hypothetical protein